MSAEAAAPETALDLRDYLAVLRRRRRSVAVLTILTLLSAVAFSLRQTPIYASSAKVLVKATTANQQLEDAPPILSLETETQLVESAAVAQIAAKKLGEGTGATEALQHLDVSVPTNTQILVISYSSPDPLAAQRGAQAFAESYLKFKTAEALETFGDLRASYERQITELQTQLEASRLAVTRSDPGSVERLEAQGQLATLNGQMAIVQSQLINLSTLSIDPGAIVQDADLPSAPVSPNHALNAALGLFVGLSLGVGVAFLRERLDDRLRGREDLEEHIGVPVFVVIPKVTAWGSRSRAFLATLEEPKGAVSEAYRTLRTSILFMAAQTGLRTLMISSASAGEGKTTTAVNVAVVLAQAGKRVILVSGDLRKPRAHRFFDGRPVTVSNDRGFVDVVAGQATLQEVLRPTDVDGLWVLPSGAIPSRPAEIAQAERTGELLLAIARQADFVIIDSAPTLVVSDALAMAVHVDGVLYVADAAETHRATVVRARQQMEQVGARIVGAVLNNFDPAEASYGYGYGYRYTYRYQYGYGSSDGPDAALEDRGGEPSRRRRSRT